MTPKQIDMIQQSLPAILALRDRVSTCFHERFVSVDSAPRAIFAGADIRRQGALLINAVAAVVEAHSPGEQECGATALRQYHLSYGVRAHHFLSAATVLTGALEQELGSPFHPGSGRRVGFSV